MARDMDNRFVCKTFSQLTGSEMYEILKVRQDVFVVEQECIYKDADDIDYVSYHLFSMDSNGKVDAYLRIFKREGETSTWQLGRVLTTKRGIGLGGELLREAIRIVKEELSGKEIYIEAQCYALGYYEKAGFVVTSEEFLEDGIPHKAMRCNCRYSKNFPDLD